MFKAYEIKPDIFWVGALEWEERSIHGIYMPDGSTNNAYLIKDEKTTLVDTCIEPHFEELVSRISDVADPSKIDYIIANHGEKDHAGSIGRLLEIAHDAKVVASSPQGIRTLKAYYGDEHEFVSVRSGDTLNIGKRDLMFSATPMVHWPDNMVTYSAADKLLFSNDAFGQFFASSKRFDDEVDLGKVMWHAKRYFANILAPYTRQTSKALKVVKSLEPDMIAPAHGVIWRSRIDEVFDLYEKLCSDEPEDQAVVVFASMYGSTARMALAITEAFMNAGIDVRLWDLQISDLSTVMTDVFTARYLALGSPTHNMTVLPEMAEFLGYFKGLHPKGGRLGISFGSCGWDHAAQIEMADALTSAGYEIPIDPLSNSWNESPENDKAVFESISQLVAEKSGEDRG